MEDQEKYGNSNVSQERRDHFLSIKLAYSSGADAVDIAIEAFQIRNEAVPQKWLDLKQVYDEGMKILENEYLLEQPQEKYDALIRAVIRNLDDAIKKFKA